METLIGWLNVGVQSRQPKDSELEFLPAKLRREDSHREQSKSFRLRRRQTREKPNECKSLKGERGETKMAAVKTEKKTLSKSILEMKFMKKSKEKYCKEKDEEEGRAAFASEVTEAMREGGDKFVLEPSFVPCQGLTTGRLSYHGMNPEIERLTQREKQPKEKAENADEMEITDVEMARRYSTLIGTISNKFKSKNQKRSFEEPPPKKRAKFLKPKDD